MIQNYIPTDRLLDPEEIQWKETAYCLAHKKECPIVFPENGMLCLGAPCVLFSRIGKRQKFDNVTKAQLHSVATAAMIKVGSSCHENVVGFCEARLALALPWIRAGPVL